MYNFLEVIRIAIETVLIMFLLLSINALVIKTGDGVGFILLISLTHGVIRIIETTKK